MTSKGLLKSGSESRSVVVFVDVLFIFLSSYISHAVLLVDDRVNDRYIIATFVIALCVILFNLFNDNYFRWQSSSIVGLFKDISITWLFSGAVTGMLIFLLDESEYFSRRWVLLTIAISYFLSVFSRIILKAMVWRMRTKGKLRRSVFIIGDNYSIKSVGKRLRKYKAEGYVLSGIKRIRHSEDQYDLIDLLDRIQVSDTREVWICLPLEMGSIVRAIMYTLRNETLEVRFLPNLNDLKLLNHSVSEVVGRYSIDLSVTPMSGQARVLKRIEDLVIGGMILLLISPICIGIAFAVKLTSKGPVLFKQVRTGVNGQEVKVYKFRSMKVHHEKQGQVTQATKNDSRLTSIGGFLRRTSLDELPQFINVLQGHMSIVGPRPHALAHNEYYKDLVESYMRRHMVKPGITGWAQVNGYRGETDTLDKMKKRVEYDLWYIDNWSLWLDIKIIIATVFKGFINKNAY